MEAYLFGAASAKEDDRPAVHPAAVVLTRATHAFRKTLNRTCLQEPFV
jgi:hypothetical protein